MLNNRFQIAALAIMLTAAVAASPGDDERREYYERRGPVPFEVMDLNADGVVTAAEHQQVHSERQRLRAAQGYPMRGAAGAPRFEQIDRDGNGSIDRDELSDWQAQRMQQRGMGRGGRWGS